MFDQGNHQTVLDLGPPGPLSGFPELEWVLNSIKFDVSGAILQSNYIFTNHRKIMGHIGF